MNYHKRVLQFVLIISLTLLLHSIVLVLFNIKHQPLQNISIISDVVQPNKNVDTTISTTSNKTPPISISTGGGTKQLINFETPEKFTAFNSDTSKPSLQVFCSKLAELKKGKKKKIRIAYLGDSMIEDDLISMTLRSLLQQKFGGYGVGYLPISTELAGNRPTATVTASATWQEFNFRNNPSKEKLYLSGRVFLPQEGSSVSVKDKTTPANALLYKYLLTKGSNGKESFVCTLIDSSALSSITYKATGNIPVFGISTESPTGIIVDNFSFRGNGGNEFANFDTSFLKSIQQQHSYDLIIMQYGVNLFVKPSDIKFDWYYQPMKKSVEKLKRCFADADIILMGCADRAFKYNNEYQTAKGLANIIAMQQKIAFETNVHFYNTFTSMGGQGSIIKWVNSKPPLAYKDYMHPNSAGSVILGNGLFNAIMKEYNLYLRQP